MKYIKNTSFGFFCRNLWIDLFKSYEHLNELNKIHLWIVQKSSEYDNLHYIQTYGQSDESNPNTYFKSTLDHLPDQWSLAILARFVQKWRSFKIDLLA